MFNYYLKTQPIKSGRYRQLSINSISEFCIPNENKGMESKIADKVVQLIKENTKSQNITKLEGEIDNLVLDLYGLTDDEKTLVSKMTE